MNGKRINIDKKKFLEMYYTYKSITATAKALGYSFDGIRNYMKRENIALKYKSIYQCNEDFFKNETEEAFYWAGFIAADGCILQGKRKAPFGLKIALAVKDINHIIKFKKSINSTSLIKNYKNNKIKCAEISIYSKKICDDLLKFNIYPRKSLSYEFPEWLKQHPLNNHFIRGYVDGDGCFGNYKQKNRKTTQFIFSVRGTPMFLTELYKIIDNKCKFNIINRKINMTKNIGSLGYSGNKRVKEITKFLYQNATFYLERKYKIIKCLL